jgi:site-specific DNA recombinase
MEVRPENEHIFLPEGITPAIVTVELWQRAQERLSNNKGDTKRNERSPHLLRGHITCGKCRKRMYAMPKQDKNGRRYRYYRCASETVLPRQRCGSSAVPADVCEQWVWDQVKEYLENPGLIAEQVKRMQGEDADPQLILDREIARGALERNIQIHQRLIKRLRNADGLVADLIERELSEVEQEYHLLQKTIADLDERIAEQEHARLNLKGLYEYCQDVRRNLSTFSFDDKRLALAALGITVVANGRDWRLVGTLPGQVVEMKSASSNCSPLSYRAARVRRLSGRRGRGKNEQ